MSEIRTDYNIGLEMVNCYAKYFEHLDTKLNGLIDNLAQSNIEIKIISDVMNKLAHRKNDSEKGKIDFNGNETIKRYIVHIHKNNPTIFDGLIKGFPEHLLNTTNPEKASTAFTQEEITLDNILDESLRGIDMSRIKIDILTAAQIDVVVQGLDGQLKMHTADLNENMMKVNKGYDDRSQMTEHARQVLKQSSDLLESINRKMIAR